MYAMVRTTVYLPEELKNDLKRTARTVGRSEADLIREGVMRVVADNASPRPRFPLFKSDQPLLAEQVDQHLKGFGDR